VKAQGFRVVIPARYASTRFPGKALAKLAGQSMIQRVYEQAGACGATEVLIATDDERIAEAAQGFGAQVIMTSSDHQSGSDRIAEVAKQRQWNDDDIIVNVQGDAPLIPAEAIDQVAGLLLDHSDAAIATLCTALTDAEAVIDPNIVKVVFDASGKALYFSRSPIPAVAHGAQPPPQFWRHVGIYAYRAGALRRLAATEPCALERSEKLEQLRAMWLGMEIRVGVAEKMLGPDVDTPEDLAAAEAFIAAN